MNQKWSGLILAAAVLAFIGLHAEAQQERAAGMTDPQQDRAPVPQQFTGAGQWRTRGDATGQARSWRMHAVELEDGAVRAKLSLLGVAGLEDVTVEGQIIGKDAFGVLLDDSGKQKATFNAKISGDGSGGTFVLGTGESGTWEYDASTKAELSNATRELTPPN